MQINFGLAQRVVKENLKFMMGLLFILNLQVVAREIIGFVNNNTAAGDYGIQISSTSGGSTYVNHTELKDGGDVHIHDGNLKLASGHGIDFYAYATSRKPIK